ncbi:hypothetical protein BCV70DRAFT_51658 [Testicularia cyperi]|uniref:Uncharacterized protein n=1 Tax=Testicularia cyperi TaxID=1882483 RepID=A0A317XVG8_9BASI|nr:hypothetical protein BCV70DRAFT_51658 [Testicularia cyperi]
MRQKGNQKQKGGVERQRPRGDTVGERRPKRKCSTSFPRQQDTCLKCKPRAGTDDYSSCSSMGFHAPCHRVITLEDNGRHVKYSCCPALLLYPVSCRRTSRHTQRHDLDEQAGAPEHFWLRSKRLQMLSAWSLVLLS